MSRFATESAVDAMHPSILEDRDMSDRGSPLSRGSVPFNLWLTPDWRGYFTHPPQLQGKRFELVVRDERSWAELWHQLTTSANRPAPHFPVPPIDFTREMLVAISIGLHSDGYTVELDDVRVDTDRIVIRYHRGWDIGQSLTDSFRTPVIVARIPRDDDHPVTFVDESTPLT
jgi:hypothetical protein